MSESCDTPSDSQACENTDRELWREREGDYYADSIHVTERGGIGINCGGMVYVKPLREWHRLAKEDSVRSEAEVIGAINRTAKASPSAGGDTFAEGAYMEGVRDAATYIGGCTFAEGDIRLVRTVISLLHAFAAQGGYGKWKTVRSATPTSCPYCTSDNEAIRTTYYDQTCAGCVKRMGDK